MSMLSTSDIIEKTYCPTCKVKKGENCVTITQRRVMDAICHMARTARAKRIINEADALRKAF